MSHLASRAYFESRRAVSLAEAATAADPVVAAVHCAFAKHYDQAIADLTARAGLRSIDDESIRASIEASFAAVAASLRVLHDSRNQPGSEGCLSAKWGKRPARPFVSSAHRP